MPFDEAGVKPAAGAQPGLDPRHPAGVALVIIAKQVQQAVQRQYPKLRAERVPRLGGLLAGDPDTNHDIAQTAPLVRPASPKR